MSKRSEKKIGIALRKALPGDVELLIALGTRCFYEAFHEVTAPDDMEAYIAATFNKSAIKHQIRDVRSLVFIADVDAAPAGYAYSHPAVPPECVKDKAAIKLERLYLRKRYYGCAVGDALMRISLAESRSHGYQSIWLSSWELNDRANAFYKKWGFTVVGHQKFTVGRDIQSDFILGRKI